jgi:asparagine synthase (glutamine-hydrolysing)
VTPGLFENEFAGVHDLRADRRAGVLVRGALPGATLFESGSLTVGSRLRDASDHVHASLAGRVHDADELRRTLGLAPDAPMQHALAAGYERWGRGLLERICGPFALVVWDHHRRRGLLAQDQLGGRSLFTFSDGSRLCFATEVALLLRLLPRRPEADDVAIAYHLVDHSIPDGRMLFRGVSRLGGGRHLLLSDTGRSEGRHWAPRYAGPLQAPRRELAARLRAELTTAVANATPGAGTSALLLSGGVDSSIVAALAAPRAGDLRAFSAAFLDDPEVDETRWARRVADGIGLPLATVPIERREPLDAADAYLRAWELPLPAPGLIIEAPLIAAAARTGADVVLDGQGGDELLGAAHFLIADRLRRGRALSAWCLARRYPGLGSRPSPRHVRLILTSVGVRGALGPVLHERVRRRRSVEHYTPGWLRAAPARLFVETEDPWRWKRLDGPRWWAALADTLTRGRERADIADYVRRRARSSGLDGRSPLLDLRLVELVLRLPPQTNFDPVMSRPLVRHALEGALPADVLARRDKSTFSAYYHRTLLAERNLSRIRGLLGPRRAAVGDYVHLERVHRDLLDHPPAVGEPGWRRWAEQVWNIATAELWLRAHGG